MNTSVYIIIPAYNEEAVIRKTILQLLEYPYRIVLVDDGSTDGTRIAAEDLPVHYIRHAFNLGQGAALQTGIAYAIEKGAAFIVTFDADGQHDVQDIPQMLDLLKDKNADIVFGSRFLAGASTNMSLIRKLFIQIARLINFIFTGVLLSDAHNGLRVLNRKAACSIVLTENGMAHATEILIQARKHHLKIAERPVRVLYTDYSRKKGQPLMHGFKIIQDLFLYKLFK